LEIHLFNQRPFWQDEFDNSLCDDLPNLDPLILDGGRIAGSNPSAEEIRRILPEQ
jgi:hypothetical protein